MKYDERVLCCRFLDRYEKVHYLGEVGERANDDDEDSRHRRWSARALHSVPLTYNYSQHNVNGKYLYTGVCLCPSNSNHTVVPICTANATALITRWAII